MTDEEWKQASKEIDNCYNFAPAELLKDEKASQNIAVGSLLTAIFLPLIFFGGTKLCKYLFPERSKASLD